MKQKHRLKYRQQFALACPGFFFTLSFWSLGLLIGTSIYFLINNPSSIQSIFVTNLVSSIPITSLDIYDTPQCPSGSRLLFSFNLPGIAETTCFRSLDDSPYIQIGTGWWRCKSGLFRGFQAFENTLTSTIWNIGQKFICVNDIELSIDHFDYISQEAINTPQQSPDSNVNILHQFS
jgi:hypothetical protein